MYVKRYRIKPFGPHRPLANKLLRWNMPPDKGEVARKKILEEFPNAAAEYDEIIKNK